VHWLTDLKVGTSAETAETLPEIEFGRGKKVAMDLSMPDLTKAWQILLKGHGEAQYTSFPLEAVEMVLVRLAHAADLPSPSELVSKITEERDTVPESDPVQGQVGAEVASPNPSNEIDLTTKGDVRQERPPNFDKVVTLFAEHGEMRLYAYIQDHVRPVSFRVGHIVIHPGESPPPKLAMTMVRHLNEWTGRKWVVEVSDANGDKTVAERKTDKENLDKVKAAEHPRIQALLESFPESEVVAVRNVSKKKAEEIREGK
jgi:DNA polymerase-3 subunit gamma/tau